MSIDREQGDIHLSQSFVLPEAVLESTLIAIGASTGGTEALVSFFHRLPARMPGMVVVQHMPPVFTKMYADRLQSELPFEVVEATHGAPILPGSIHIAPGSHQMTVRRQGSGWVTCLGGTERVGGHCPAVDVLFGSVAREAGDKAVGIILTGMGSDGAKGLLEMRRQGAFTLGQDEGSSVVYGMPRKAFECGAVSRQGPLSELPLMLLGHLSRPRAPS